MALTDVLRRLRWLKFLYPGQTGLQYEQGFWNTKRQRHLSYDHTSGIVSGLEVTATGAPDLFVHVAAGRVVDVSGDDSVIASVQDIDLTSFVPGGGTQTVYIVIYYTLVEIEPYVVPELGTSQNKYNRETPIVKAQLAAPSGDEIELARVEVATGATQIINPANPNSPGNNNIDQRYRQYQNREGLRLRTNDDLPDTALSAVTVGHEGCDFDSIPDALSYVNSLTRTVRRQVTVRVFEKPVSEDWTLTAAITIPTYTHLVGVGKPTLVIANPPAATPITVSAGASIQNFQIDLEGDGASYIVYFGGDEGEAINVDVRSELSTPQAIYAFYLDADKCRVVRCRVLPYSIDSSKACRGVYVGAQECVVSQCYLEALEYALDLQNTGYRVSDVRCDATKATANRVVNITSHGVVTNLIVRVTDGFTYGVYIDGICEVSGLVVESAPGAYDIIGLYAGGGCRVSSFRVTGCWVQLTGASQLSNGFIDYSVDDGKTALSVTGDGCMMTGLQIDRGGKAAFCIEPSNADECTVTGCRLDNTDNVQVAIDNTDPTSTDWLCVGNMVDVATPLGNGWDISGEKVI